jgi:hypothetical protein
MCDPYFTGTNFGQVRVTITRNSVLRTVSNALQTRIFLSESSAICRKLKTPSARSGRFGHGWQGIGVNWDEGLQAEVAERLKAAVCLIDNRTPVPVRKLRFRKPNRRTDWPTQKPMSLNSFYITE